MPFCSVCNKEHISEDLNTIGNQSVCCLSCVGLLKANKKDACSYCRRPVWKDNYYEVDNLYFCSEKCKNKVQEKLIKEKGSKYVKFRHFKEEKYYKEKIQNNLDEPSSENYDNNEWNRNSFIQKQPDKNEMKNKKRNKDDRQILYRIEKSLHSKNIYSYKNIDDISNKESYNDNEKQKNNLIKNMKRYFSEGKTYFNSNNYKHKYYNNKTNKKKDNTNKLVRKDNNITYSNKKIYSFPSLYQFKFSMNERYSTEVNPFVAVNVYKDKKNNETRSKTLKNENNFNKTLGYSSKSNLVFNPIRKTENTDIIKKNSYPLDSLAFPIDSVAIKTGKKDSLINSCNNSRKPILIKNSNALKDFCSYDCRKEYYKNNL